MTTTSETIFPCTPWEHRSPEAVRFSADKLNQAERQLAEDAGGKPYRIAIVRHGYLIAEWEQGVDRERKFGLASAAKSMFSSMLGVAIGEGKIPSADAKVIDYYPEMMEVDEDEGPKPGRFAREKDRDITFRQLICNTSGYLKPDEMPGKVFHYQTFDMNILTNAIATVYGLYDSSHPERLPGAPPRPRGGPRSSPKRGSRVRRSPLLTFWRTSRNPTGNTGTASGRTTTG